MSSRMKFSARTKSRNLGETLSIVLRVGLLLLPLAGLLLIALKPAEAENIQTIALSRNPDIIKPYRFGSYSNPEVGIDQISVNSPDRDGGAVAASWSLEELDLTNAKTIKLTFDLLTNVTAPGNFGPRVGASVGLATSFANCCPMDRSGILQKNAEVVSVQLDCCYLPARLIFDVSRWVNPDAPNSGDRVAKVCQEVFSGYANDATWHSYVIEMNLTSHTSTWMVDGGMATSTCPTFSFVPTHVVFWAQGHDVGNSAIAQLRNPILTISRTETSGAAPNSGPTDSPLLQWWFWTIASLSATSGALLFTSMRSRSQPKAGKQTAVQDKGSVCQQCGTQMPPNSTFCGKCGHKLSEER